MNIVSSDKALYEYLTLIALQRRERMNQHNPVAYDPNLELEDDPEDELAFKTLLGGDLLTTDHQASIINRNKFVSRARHHLMSDQGSFASTDLESLEGLNRGLASSPNSDFSPSFAELGRQSPSMDATMQSGTADTGI